METAILGLFSSLFTTPFLVFIVGIAIAVIILRKFTEFCIKKLGLIIPAKAEDVISDIWTQWILRGLPLLIGICAALFIGDYPFPEQFADSNSGKALLGLIAGLFSSPVYSIIKYHIKKNLPDSIKEKIENVTSALKSSNTTEEENTTEE